MPSIEWKRGYAYDKQVLYSNLIRELKAVSMYKSLTSRLMRFIPNLGVFNSLKIYNIFLGVTFSLMSVIESNDDN